MARPSARAIVRAMRWAVAVLALASVAVPGAAPGSLADRSVSARSPVPPPAPSPSATVPPASPASAPVGSPPAIPWNAEPDPRAGTIVGNGWRYDGASGVVTAQPTPVSSGSTSPSGRYAIEQRRVIAGGLIDHTELWLTDSLQQPPLARLLYRPTISADAPKTQPNPALPPYVFRATQISGSWSPDERYLTLWILDEVSASMDADGRPLIVIDVATGKLTELGVTLLRKPAWRAPHTLAYVSGGDRFTWSGKTLRIWSPERGARDVTGPAEIGLEPVWDATGRLWFVTARSGQYLPDRYFALEAEGDRSIAVFDPATGSRSPFARVPEHADEGARPSADGAVVLLLRRAVTRDWRANNEVMELWIANADGSEQRRLLRLPGSGFGYYGSFPSLTALTWSRP